MKQQKKNITLQDQLAVERTHLANRRTLLAFFNSSSALLIAGLTFIRFFTGHPLYWAGWIFLGISFSLFVFGVINFFLDKKRIQKAQEMALRPISNEDESIF